MELWVTRANTRITFTRGAGVRLPRETKPYHFPNHSHLCALRQDEMCAHPTQTRQREHVERVCWPRLCCAHAVRKPAMGAQNIA